METSCKKQLLNDIIKKYKCMMCNNSIVGAIITCSNDHQICLNCSKKTNSCSICKTYVFNNNKTMENMAKTILATTPMYECYYKDCNQTFTIAEFKNHLRECTHKEWHSPFNSLVRHKKLEDHLGYLSKYNTITIRNNLFEKHTVNIYPIPNNSVYVEIINYINDNTVIYIIIKKYGSDISYGVIWQSNVKKDCMLSSSTRIFANMKDNTGQYMNYISYYHTVPNLYDYITNIDELKTAKYYFPIDIKNNSISKFKNHDLKLEFIFGFQTYFS